MPDRIFKFIFIIGWAVFTFGIYTPNMRRYRRQQVNVTHSRPLDIVLDMLAFLGWQVIPLVFAFAPRLTFGSFDLPNWCGWLGTAIFAFSIWLFGRAYADLGKSWSPKIDITEKQKLVTDGVYTHIRHPVYAAMWLWAIAQPLLMENWIAGFALAVCFLPLYLIRVPREEKMMLENFGEEYRAYMERTGRILPHLG
jgi:protein-S-isoprenylcysteine O-methyltransferase Ste14